jgi:nucleotidyltransferase/DNA polymerase involved in DNA repair
LKIRLAPFRTFTRSRTLPSPTRDPALVGATARELLDRFERDAPVRLVGVGVAGLVRDGASADRDPTPATDDASLQLALDS